MQTLTDVAIRKAKPTAKTRKLFDGGGLYLELTPTGRRWWRFKYRFNGKEKRISLGTYPDVSLKTARDRRAEARSLVADGVDPSEDRKARQAEKEMLANSSFESVARDWFERHVSKKTVGHSSRVIRLLELHVFPAIGSVAITEITAPQLLQVLRPLEECDKLETAHRARGICGQVFRYAIQTGRAERDVAADLRGALPPAKTRHFAAVTEPERVGDILRAIDAYDGTLVVSSALRIAPLVFVRPGELRHAEWAHIDLDAAEWRFTVTKTNTPHIVPLSRQAVKILKKLKLLTGRGRYVFPSGRNPRGDRPMSDNAILAAMRRMGIPKEQMTGHGFRAMARTILDEELGFRPDIIEHQLAHAVKDPNGRAYNRTAHLAERRKMMQDWADYLSGLKTAAI